MTATCFGFLPKAIFWLWLRKRGIMADLEYHCSASTPDKSDNSALNPVSVCKFCTGHLSEIESLNSELQTPKRIIQLLQDDLNGIKNQLPCRDLSAPHVSDATNCWKTTTTKTRKSSDQRYFPNSILNDQKPIPVIQTSNRFHVLHNLQDVQMETSQKPNWTSGTQRSKASTHSKKVSWMLRDKPLKKVTLIGDSHIWGLATELKNLMGQEYWISSTFMPGTGLRSITNLAKSEIATHSKCNTVIVCGGSNDASKNELQTGLNSINKFTNLRTNTSMMIISLPQRHDLSSNSCVNKEIFAFKRKLHKIMKNKELVKILDYNISREGYTRHRLHLNSTGKAMLAMQIVLELIKQTEVTIINPIPVAGKKSSSEPTPSGSAMGPSSPPS